MNATQAQSGWFAEMDSEKVDVQALEHVHNYMNTIEPL